MVTHIRINPELEGMLTRNKLAPSFQARIDLKVIDRLIRAKRKVDSKEYSPAQAQAWLLGGIEVGTETDTLSLLIEAIHDIFPTNEANSVPTIVTVEKNNA